MAACLEVHKYLVNGEGLCSKPEFVNYWFCENKAFGNGAGPFLSCPEHGGPTEKLPEDKQAEVNLQNHWRSENPFAAFMERLGPEGRKNVTVL